MIACLQVENTLQWMPSDMRSQKMGEENDAPEVSGVTLGEMFEVADFAWALRETVRLLFAWDYSRSCGGKGD